MRKYLLGIAVFAISFGILSVSFLESASVKYAFATPVPSSTSILGKDSKIQVDYFYAYPGKIMPDSPFWQLKALRDKVVLLFSLRSSVKAEKTLLFADKRIQMAKILFEMGKPDLGMATLAKAEKYLEQSSLYEQKARGAGDDTVSFLTTLATASLKHRLTIDEILAIAPDDVKPEIIKLEDYAKNTYKTCRDALNSKGVTAPKSPFDWD